MREVLGCVDRHECVAVTSELSLAECLVKPLESRRDDLVQAYESMMTERDGLEMVPVGRGVLIEAARLRATTRLRLPDAIHAGTALHASCDLLLTNDPGFRAVRAIETRLLSDLE